MLDGLRAQLAEEQAMRLKAEEAAQAAQEQGAQSVAAAAEDRARADAASRAEHAAELDGLRAQLAEEQAMRLKAEETAEVVQEEVWSHLESSAHGNIGQDHIRVNQQTIEPGDTCIFIRRSHPDGQTAFEAVCANRGRYYLHSQCINPGMEAFDYLVGKIVYLESIESVHMCWVEFAPEP